MPAITNFSDQSELINLAFSPDGRGPYFVRQTGYAPSTTNFKQDVFYLRKDGTWVINLSALMLSDKELQEHFLFPNSGDALTLLGEIASTPPAVDDRLPAGKSPEEIASALKSTASKLITRIRDSKA